MLNLFSIPLSAVIISFLIPFLLMYTGLLLESTGAFIIKLESFKDLGFAKVDTNRELRQGMSEVIYGKSKTKEQIAGIVGAMLEEKEKTILITRMSREAADYVAQQYNLNYDELSQIGIIGDMPEKNGKGRIVVATGGTIAGAGASAVLD